MSEITAAPPEVADAEANILSQLAESAARLAAWAAAHDVSRDAVERIVTAGVGAAFGDEYPSLDTLKALRLAPLPVKRERAWDRHRRLREEKRAAKR
jgi:hypothetical protein